MNTSSRLRPMASMIFVRSWPALPDERQPLLVLVAARRLAHEHQPRLGVALAEDDVLARRRQLAALAVAEIRADGFERFDCRRGDLDVRHLNRPARPVASS